jgi:predicted nucleic acid-binding protein
MIFVDTGAWIALSDKSDQYHPESVRIYTELKQQKSRFATTDYVLDETVTRLRYDTIHQRFLDAMEDSENAGILKIIRTDEALFREAVFRKYDSAVLSFTDCVSFAVCRKYGINQAFGFDRHFAMMGISLYSAD